MDSNAKNAATEAALKIANLAISINPRASRAAVLIGRMPKQDMEMITAAAAQLRMLKTLYGAEAQDRAVVMALHAIDDDGEDDKERARRLV